MDNEGKTDSMSEQVITPSGCVALQPLIAKLGHNVEEIRVRALKNILFKLDHKLICAADLVHERQLLIKLLEWFNFPNCVLKKEVLGILETLSKPISGAENLLSIGAVEFLSHLRQNVDPELYQSIDSVIHQLLSLPQNDAQNHEQWCLYETRQPVEVEQVKGSDQQASNLGTYEQSSSVHKGNRVQHNPVITHRQSASVRSNNRSLPSWSHITAAAAAGQSALTTNAPSIIHTQSSHITNLHRNESADVSNKSCLSFIQWIFLSASDRHILSVTASRLQSRSPSLVSKSCQFLLDVLFKDFPAEIFLHRPSVIQALLDLLEDNVPHKKDSSLILSAMKCLCDYCWHLHVRLVAVPDPAVFCPDQDCWKYRHVAVQGETKDQASEQVADVRETGDGGVDSDDQSSSLSDNRTSTVSDEDEDDIITEALQFNQLSVEEFCITVLSQVVPIFQGSLFINSGIIETAVILLHEVLRLLRRVFPLNIWQDGTKTNSLLATPLKNIMKNLGETIMHHVKQYTVGKAEESRISSSRQRLQLPIHRLTVINLTSFLVQFLDSFVSMDVASKVVPPGVTTVVLFLFMDELLALTHGHLRPILMKYLMALDPNAHSLGLFAQDTCQAMVNTCKFLKACRIKKLISDDRFRSDGEEDPDSQLPVQFLATVAAAPSLTDEVQVEVMKLLLIITCSASCEVHGEHLIKIAEICIETYTRSHQSATKTACRATLTQMLSSVCHRLQDSLATTATSKNSSSDSKIARHTNLLSTDHAKLLSQDVVVLVKHFCFRLTAGPSASTQNNHAIPLYLEAILVMLSSLSTALQQEKEFINVIWQLLCPALIQLLGSPLTDLTKRPKPVPPFPEEINRGGRGTGNFSKSSPIMGPIPRTIYNIATELLRLVGPLAAMRPVLESLFHRIILYPPAQQRAEALKALKEFLSSPQRLLDAAGPTIIDKDNPPSPDSPTEQKKSELDLLRLLMDGIVGSARCTDPTVASCSVACVVALLSSLEDLSQGRGLSDEHIEFLSKMKDAESWEILYQGKETYDNAASAREITKLTNGRQLNVDRFGWKSSVKVARWDTGIGSPRSPSGDIASVTERFEKDGDVWDTYIDGEAKHDVSDDEPEIRPLHPKSVHFASEDEIAMFEKHESEMFKMSRPSNTQRSGIPRKSSLPRKIGSTPPGSVRTTLKRSNSLDGKSKQKPNVQKRVGNAHSYQRERSGSDSGFLSKRSAEFLASMSPKVEHKFGIRRSCSDIDLLTHKTSSNSLQGFQLRKWNSWTSLSSQHHDTVPSDNDKDNKITQKHVKRGVIPRPRTQLPRDSPLNKSGTFRVSEENRSNDSFSSRKLFEQGSIPQRKYVESKANKIEAREKALREEKDRSPTKGTRTTLRRTRSASEHDRKQTNGNHLEKPKGILLKTQSLDETEGSRQATRKTPPQRVKINGVFFNKGKEPSPTKSPENKKVREVKKSVEENEKEGARNFARCLLGILPSVLGLSDPVAVDEALQQFASDVCEAVTCMALKRKNVPNFGTLRGRSDLVDEKSGEGATSDPCYPILNADGVYVTVYATLTLNLTLLKSGHYQKKGPTPALSQEDFIESVLNSGVPIGLSSVWLGELYRLVTTYNILGKAGYKLDSTETNRALISTLNDNMLSDKEDSTFLHHRNPSTLPPAKREGMKFARRVLLTTWDSVLEILSVPLETSPTASTNGVAVMLGGEFKRDHNRERDTICLSLDGLRRAARLCCTLGIQTRCELVLAQLANASCGGEGLEGKRTRPHSSSGSIKLHAAHVLSMDGLLAVGVELGSHAPKCWKHVFRCCTYISHLERAHFSSGVGDSSSHMTSPHTLHLHSDITSPMSESSSISDYLSGELSPNVNGVSRQDSENGSEHAPSNSGLLTPGDASRAIYALSAAVDRLFEHAANTLHLQGLLSFLHALVYASKTQLFGSPADKHSGSSGSNSQPPPSSTTLHLYRLADVILRSARNTNRPLLHLMRAWAVMAPHFVEAASHRDRHISKLAITSLHDILSELLSNRSELPHFWFHEALFKPFDGILSSQTCTEDDQEQILATISQLVETHLASIKSGWRPVFMALRNMPVLSRKPLESSDADHRTHQILDILSAFLTNKNSSVFAAAAVQCIETLLKFVRGSDCDYQYENSRSDTDSSDTSDVGTANEMCLPALEHLLNMSKKLASIYIMPSSLVFHGSHAIRLVDYSPDFSPVLSPNSSPGKPSDSTINKSKSQVTSMSSASSIASIDDTGVLRVWFLLLEGLTNVVSECPCMFQPQTLEVLFDILHSIITVPGPHFSIYVVTNLLLPMLEFWVERGNRDGRYWENTAGNFKHACGLVTELVVEELSQFLSVQGAAECVPGMIKQTLDLLLECVSQPVEGIARLGCSCLRHLLLSGGPVFTEDLWLIVSEGLREAVHTTLSNLKDLVACFQPGSFNVNGDEGMTVRVVARRDVITADMIRLQQVAEQVFLLESQVEKSSTREPDKQEPASDEDDQRSYVFVLSSVENKEKPENAERIPLRGLLVSLLSHQLLLQTLGSILLDNADSVMAQSAVPDSPGASVDNFSNEGSETSLPGLLSYLSPANLMVLFDCLMESHSVAFEFNARTGLRSLIQKLARLDAPANLLRQSTTAFTCYLHTLFQICKHSGEHFSSSHIKRILTGDRVVNNQEKVEEAHKDEVGGSPGRHNDLLKGERNADWIVRRLNEACDQLSSVYVRLFNQYKTEGQGTMSYEVELERSVSLSSTSSPARDVSSWGNGHLDDSANSPISRWKHSSTEKSPRDLKSRHCQQMLEDDLRMIELERQLLKRKEDELLQFNIWTNLVVTMLELLLSLPTLQFKAVLPAVFPAVTCLISTGADSKVKQLVCEVVRRVGSIYGIL